MTGGPSMQWWKSPKFWSLRSILTTSLPTFFIGKNSLRQAGSSSRSGMGLKFYWAFARARLDTPCNNLANPRKLSFPSVCLIQSWRTAWTGTEGPRPSSCNNISKILEISFCFFMFPKKLHQIKEHRRMNYPSQVRHGRRWA